MHHFRREQARHGRHDALELGVAIGKVCRPVQIVEEEACCSAVARTLNQCRIVVTESRVLVRLHGGCTPCQFWIRVPRRAQMRHLSQVLANRQCVVHHHASLSETCRRGGCGVSARV
jgi:hypothetical protein